MDRLDPEVYQPLKSIWRKLLCWGHFIKGEKGFDRFRVELLDVGYCLDRYLTEEPK